MQTHLPAMNYLLNDPPSLKLWRGRPCSANNCNRFVMGVTH
jgi:hypothetical protein